MPGFLYVRSRCMEARAAMRQAHLVAVARRLAPDNIAYRPPIVTEHDSDALAVFNGASAVQRQETSICLGSIFDRVTPWWKVGSEPPDGSFGLVRSDGDTTEVLSDAVGTRTLWYAETDDELVVSTSQRAIVMWLKSYDCNVEAFAWQASSGTLGPGLSWDRRIHALPPASRLTFDRRAWSSELATEPVAYCPPSGPPELQRAELHDAITDTFHHLKLNTEHGALALSGGYDSRMILLMLKDRRPPLHTVTWGRRDALQSRGSDASIARQLAETMHTHHSYFELELPQNGVDEVLERFVRLGEGRTESLSGYLDGFALWKTLCEAGLSHLFRGDEGFGCRAAATPADVYRNMKCNVLDDFRIDAASPLAELAAVQRRPARLERQPSESLAAWRDRLNAEFELPYVIGALNDLKYHYLDIVHPLVSRRIIEQARRLPDELRTDKSAFKSIVEEFGLDVPFAKCPAIWSPDAVLRHPQVLQALSERLHEQREGSGMPAALAGYALEVLPRAGGRRVPAGVERFVDRVRRRMPGAPRLDPLRLAFRVYIIGRMQALLTGDARTLH
jgi:hypothetical protein